VPDVLVRGLSQRAYDYYKQRAGLSKRSLNAEIRDVLESAVQPKMTREEWLEKARVLREEIAQRWADEGIQPEKTTAELIREDRER